MPAPIQTKDDAVSRLRAAHDDIVSFGVRSIGLFGSFVTGRQGPDSDVDVLVEFHEEQHSFDNFMGLCFFLEDLLGRPVEVVTLESLSPYLGPRILREVEHVSGAA